MKRPCREVRNTRFHLFRERDRIDRAQVLHVTAIFLRAWREGMIANDGYFPGQKENVWAYLRADTTPHTEILVDVRFHGSLFLL